MVHNEIDKLARSHKAYVPSDGQGFRRCARILQSLWREDKGLPIGEHRGKPLGSRLPADFAKESLANYLTPQIRELVRAELESASSGQVFAAPRIYNDLLSSQPLCFNLFGELKIDLRLATAVVKLLRPGTVDSVTKIRFEYSPERDGPRFLGDRTAFDVFIEYKGRDTRRGFLGIEVKYHEDMRDSPAQPKRRYDEVATLMGCFRGEAFSGLRESDLQQLWRNHLLVGITQHELGYGEGIFVFLYPAGNIHCRTACHRYAKALKDTSSFEVWTLEEVVSILSLATSASWVREVRARYLDFDRVLRA